MYDGALVQDLGRIVGSAQVLGGDARGYASDASESAGLRGAADAVVLPADSEQVCAVVAWCYERGVAIVPRGGASGFAGGAVAVPAAFDGPSVLLSLERLTRVRAFDPGLWRIQVEAGVTTATVARLARENGLYFPVDPGAAEQSQIGGNVATNAGGPHCFKHGVMRAWVTGLEAVLAPGELVSFGGALRKDVAGYDFVSLLTGSEGTLGVITAVWLRLIPRPPLQIPVAATFSDARAGSEAIERVLACGVVPATIEFLDGGSLDAAGASYPGGLAPGAGFLVICEADTSRADAGELAAALGSHARVFETGAAELWRWRDGVSIAVAAQRGGKLSEDVAVPVDRLADVIEGTVAIGARHSLAACSWGHAGDGNVHATFLLDPGDAAQRARADAAVEELFALTRALGGTVSGEHGLGWLKRGQLSRQWAPAAVGAHRAIKRALDPAGLFNPGKKTA
jgi:FAD/FMN-containing dehydrogenase